MTTDASGPGGLRRRRGGSGGEATDIHPVPSTPLQTSPSATAPLVTPLITPPTTKFPKQTTSSTSHHDHHNHTHLLPPHTLLLPNTPAASSSSLFTPTTPTLTPRDALLAATLLVLALSVRLYRISAIQTVIFDEVHFARFTSWILTRQFFFDVHPMFGKWVIAMIASALGFDPLLDTYDDSGCDFSTPAQALAARAPAAILGSLNVPLFYFLCRRLCMTNQAAFLAGFFVLLDGMHVVQSRLAMVDSILAFFTCAALLAALVMWDLRKAVYLKGPAANTADLGFVASWLVLTGVLCGLAVSVRWTAFATPAVVLVVSIFGIPPFCSAPMGWGEVLVLASSIFSAYYGSFWIFLRTLTKSGSGDAFMSESFQQCLEGSAPALEAVANGRSCNMSMWSRFLELNQKIFQYSKGIRGSDPWGSSWFQWIFNWRGALYHRTSEIDPIRPEIERQALVYVLMNPAMVLMVNAGMALFGVVLFCLIRYRSKLHVDPAFVGKLQCGCVLLFGWMGSMLPTMVVYRSGPLYQYLPGLFFAQALGALSFDMLCPRAVQTRVMFVCLTLLTAAFFYWSPWIYGLSLTKARHDSMRWLPKWD